MQLTLRLQGSELKVRGAQPADRAAGIRAVAARTATGFTAELAIPWEQLGPEAGQARSIGFDVRYHDGAGVVGWSSEHLDPLITSAYGELRLSQPYRRPAQAR